MTTATHAGVRSRPGPVPSIMARVLTMGYSLVCYAIGMTALVYLILFIADLFVPVSVNRASALAPVVNGPLAVLWNLALVAAWGAQHSLMARPAFKRWWTRWIPANAERSTYLVFVALATAALVTLWVPVPGQIWNFSGSAIGIALLAGYAIGWGIVVFASFLINHFHLFGLSQAYHQIRRTQPKSETFVTPLLYRLVRHPMMTGVLIALWAAPVMTGGRLLLAVLFTAYIFVGLRFEEKTLVQELGEAYRRYQKTTPMLIPGLRRRRSANGQGDANHDRRH